MIRLRKHPILESLPAEKGVIQASAGTGKTYLLERMVIDLILKGTNLPNILVVTFTEKATLELKARIRGMLESLVALPEGHVEAGDPAWLIDKVGQQRLSDALRCFDRSNISTIHGFCRRVLQASAFEGGSLLKQELADGRALMGRAWREVLRKDVVNSALGSFLKDVISHGLSVEDLEQLLFDAHKERGTLMPALELDPEHENHADQVLAAYPAGWEQRFEELHRDIQGLTIHYKSKEKLPDLLKDFFDLIANKQSAYSLLNNWDFDYLAKTEVLSKGGAGHELFDWMERFRQAAGTPEAMIVHRFLPRIREHLRFIKTSEGLYDHDDTILQVLSALKGPRGHDLVTRLRTDYKAALIDEFQDTDEAQWHIFKEIFNVPGHALYVIGDPKQAIYGFRGGDLPTYQQAVKDLLSDTAPQLLADNHRSTQGVINAYNLLFTGGDYAPNTGEPTTAFFSDPTIYPASSVVKCGKPGLTTLSGDGAPMAPVTVLKIKTLTGGLLLWRNIARTLAKEIKKLIQQTQISFGDPEADRPREQLRRLHFGDVQILVEKKKQGRQIAEALRLEGIPYAFFKQEGLLDSVEARDWLDCLQAVLEPRNRTHLARALVTPFFGYAWQDLEDLQGLPDDHRVVERLQEWQALAKRRQFPQMIEAMLHQSGLIQRLRLATSSERSLTNHLHLAELLIQQARQSSTDLEGVVRLLKRWINDLEQPPGENTNIQRLEGDRQAVQILTMHQSKGLESPIVALFGFTRPSNRSSVRRFHLGGQRCIYLGSPPSKHAIKEAIDVEKAYEAERLYYVALTRAQAHLILPCFFVQKSKGEIKHPEANYKIINRRLRSILEKEEGKTWFQVVEIPTTTLEQTEQPAKPDLSEWKAPSLPAADQTDYEALRQGARPILTTSYTKLHGVLQPHTGATENQEIPLDGEAEDMVVTLDQGALPRGAKTGIFLHELLEEVALQSVVGVAFEAWWADPKRKDWVRDKLRAYDLPSKYAGRAAQMVYDALQEPLSGASLAQHDHILRELRFLARYLETEDQLHGAIDILFERGGKIHLLDWKSDALNAYDPISLDDRVRSKYLLQVKIYMQIVLDYFGINDAQSYERRFGDVHYVFLRGLPGQGVWSWHPAWGDILEWRKTLADLHERLANG